MEIIPEPKSVGVAGYSRRPAAVTAAGWVMLVGSVLGGLASAAALVALVQSLPTDFNGFRHFGFVEDIAQVAVAVVGCRLALGVWKGTRLARAWTFCLGGTIATVAAVHAGYYVAIVGMYLFRGDTENSLSFLALTGLNLVTCAVAVTPVLLLTQRSVTAWFPPGPPVSGLPSAVPLLAVTAAVTVAVPLISSAWILMGFFTSSHDLTIFSANLLVTILVPLLVIAVAFGGRRSDTPLAQAAALAAFGYACYRGPIAFVSSPVDSWFGDIGSIVILLAYLALLIVGIAGLRLMLRGDVLRLRPPMAPDPHR